ncbi:MAG: porin family protein, partial [Sulfurimonas sp.]
PPVEPVVETPVVEEAPAPMPGNFYLGLGYSYMNWESDSMEVDGDAVTLVAGYNFNKYIGVEGRYSMTVGDLTASETGYPDRDSEISNLAIYLKPMLPLGGVTLYGLLGYGELTVDDDYEEASESGFQWGAGASMAINERLSVFADYTCLYDDENFDNPFEPNTADIYVYSVNVGVTYNF